MSKSVHQSLDSATEKKVVLAFIAVCILWGSTYLAIRIGVAHMPPMLFAGIRFLIAGALMLAYVKLKGLPFPTTGKSVAQQALVGLFLLYGGNGLVVWTEQWVSSGSASLMVATVPLFMALIELLLPNRTKIGWSGWTGLLLGFSGVAFLVLSKSGATGIDLMGGFLMLVAALCWAIGSVYSKFCKPTGSIYANIGFQMLAGGVALTATGLLTGEVSRLSFNLTGVGAMLYLIFFGSIIGYSSYIYVLQKWPASKASTYAYVNPVVAVFLGALILQEPLTLNVFISAAVILAGVYMVQRVKS